MKRRRLMPAEVQAKIALELVAVAPGAPIFLTRMLDTPVGQPLGLDASATATAERSPMYNIESAGGTVLRKGYPTEAAAEAALEQFVSDEAAYGPSAGVSFTYATVVPA